MGSVVLEPTAIGGVSNNGAKTIDLSQPYIATIGIEGTAPLLFHRWDCDEVEAKAAAAKNSRGKKMDNLESYVYRNAKNELCLPGEYIRMAIIVASKYKQDPRSPRASAQNLFKAGIAVLDELCSLGTKKWDYEDRRRATVQRNGITRIRPAFHAGWRATVTLSVLTPEYIAPPLLNEIVQSAGRLIGVGDFRPTFGRFAVVRFEAK